MLAEIRNSKTVFKGLLLACFLALSIGIANATNTATGPHIKVALYSEQQALVPGSTQWLGVYFQPDPEWHTYWLNPGDSGEAPTLGWHQQQHLTFGEIQWPVPVPIRVAHLVNYGYKQANLLMVPITISESAPVGSKIAVTVDLSWLVCKEDCIPGWATLVHTMQVSNETGLASQSDLFAQTRKVWPSSTTLAAQHEINSQSIAVDINLSQVPSEQFSQQWFLFPFRNDVTNHAAPQQTLLESQRLIQLLEKSDYFQGSSENLQFLLSDGEQGFYVDSQLLMPGQGGNDSVFSPGHSLFVLLLMAFAGGLILNLMPCVLPVISMKALSLPSNGVDTSSKWGYFIGVVVSFLLFALVVVTLRGTGNSIGWGFHMQSPVMVALLAFIFTYIAMSLLDAAPSGSRFAGIGQQLTQGKGFASQFFTGFLAVLVASPCTAPFMATAMGVAMVSPAWVSFALFLALAVGFALPLSLVQQSRRIAGWIPKPGAWMQTFRQCLSFPMLATVVWLLWVYQGQTNPGAQLALLSALLLLAFLLWLGSTLRGKMRIIVAIVAPVFVIAFLSYQAGDKEPGTLVKQEFSAATLQSLRNQNQVVLVNMTADWCITCKVNEQVALNSEEFSQLMAHPDVHYMVGDWTNKNQPIFDYLKSYQRSGVPLYVVYAGTKNATVLPQILTPDIVKTAINNALQEIKYVP